MEGEIVRLNLIPFSPLYQRKFLLEEGERKRERETRLTVIILLTTIKAYSMSLTMLDSFHLYSDCN